jgi:hypothetical protein
MLGGYVQHSRIPWSPRVTTRSKSTSTANFRLPTHVLPTSYCRKPAGTAFGKASVLSRSILTSKVWSLQGYQAGSINAQVRGWVNYYGPSIAPSCTPWHCASTNTWSDGRCRSSNDCGTNRPRPEPGWLLCDSTIPVSSPTGTCSHTPTADLWGPDEARVSRPVLREREGEVPSRHSPVPHAGICAGGRPRGRSLPQSINLGLKRSEGMLRPRLIGRVP